jgi:hypothetical protein
VPIEHVLARDFGCSSCGDKFYGMFETISAYGELPRIDWYWGLALAENGKWLVDYPPVRLSEYAAQRRAALQARDEKTAALRQSLESKMPFLSTRLIPLTNKFRIGQPMPFRVELTNAGATAIHYVVGGLNHYGLVVRDERRGTVLTNTAGPVQVAVRTMELPARSAVVLAEALDITRNHNLTAPGKYSVQFDGRTLEVGARVPGEEMDRFGRPLGDETSQASFDRVAYQVIHKTAAEHLFAVTNKFPSNVVRIDVRR